MKVKIGDTVYDAEDQPIMLILNDKDKQNISSMHPRANRYICYPDNMDFSTIDQKWLEE